MPFPRSVHLPRASVEALRDLGVGWQERVRSARVRAELAGGAVVVFAGLLLARRGTLTSRGVAVAGALIAAALLIWVRLRESDLWKDPARVIQRLAGRVDADRAGRAIRALALIDDIPRGGTSPELAWLHVERTLDALPRHRILNRAAKIGARYGQASFLLVAGAFAIAVTRGFHLVEGADVLLASRHQAPWALSWLDGLAIEARPPEYLHESEREVGPSAEVALPRGTLLTFRGVPIHPGRRLLLTDGKSDVPFVDDGTGHVVARWPLADSGTFRVVARFGEVDVREDEAAAVSSIADEPPTVLLQGAPRDVRLADVGTAATIPIRYEASDDHGLREVHLVLRAGGREERRVLARLDGETEMSRGGYSLHASDPFIKKSHAPIEVRVEAKDNDAVTGPKWGASAPITIIPPEAGEPEALRLDALRTLRDGFVDSLAARIDRAVPATAAGRAAFVEADARGVLEDDLRLDAVARGSYAGVGVGGRIVALLRGQMRRVKAALAAERKAPGPRPHALLVSATERLVLVTDAVTRGLAHRDARSVARGLADVADDLVLGASQMQRAEERQRGEARADGSVVVLEGGARSLRRLGALGRDLGEIVVMDLARVARARAEGDIVHAEVAASDLAARLKAPDPSFGAQGSSRRRAGVEAGGGRGMPGQGEPSDEAQRALDEAAEDLGKLSSDHAENLGKVEQALSEPEGSDEGAVANEETRRHARAVRDATRSLPSVGAGSNSWTNKGAAAREHAEAMAGALEEGNVADAVTSGHSALDALDEARHVAQRERWTRAFSASDEDTDRVAADRRLAAARQKLEPEVQWAEEQLRSMRRRAAQRRAPELSGRGEEEQRLAERAGDLRDREAGEEVMPEAALEALHHAERAAQEAASALKRGEAEEGLAQQREAQRKLEEAKDALGGDAETEGEDSGAREGRGMGHADIPKVDAHKGPEAFRRRVIEGLGQAASGRQKDAVRRYADGLLR